MDGKGVAKTWYGLQINRVFLEQNDFGTLDENLKFVKVGGSSTIVLNKFQPHTMISKRIKKLQIIY